MLNPKEDKKERIAGMGCESEIEHSSIYEMRIHDFVIPQELQDNHGWFNTRVRGAF